MELKFKGKEEEEKNKEMVCTIIDLDKNFIFANLKKDEDHEKLFGMNKISYQIIEALKNIKSFNMKIITKELEKMKKKFLILNKK